MNQELQYLRDELNQRVIIQNEYSNKMINMVLMIWGGVLAISGAKGFDFTAINRENITLYFILATIFFISNIISFLAARKYYHNSDSIFKLAAYITVFYEKRLNKNFKVGEDFGWELSSLEIMSDYLNKDNMYIKNIYIKNNEYKILIIISTVFITFFSAMILLLGYVTKTTNIQLVVLFIICAIYIVSSSCLICKVPKYTSLKDSYGMKIWNLNVFFKYSIDTGYYTIDEIKDRFGNIYDKCLQEAISRKWPFPVSDT